MTEMLMTEAQTNSAEASQTPTGSPMNDGVPSYGGDRIGNQQPNADSAQTQQAQGEASEGENAGNDQESTVLGAPESYQFKADALGENGKFDESVLATFSDVAKELNLSQDAAQKVIDKVAPQIAQRQIEQIQAIQTEWAQTAVADKEYGGEKLQENLSVAKKALDAFASPELRELLNTSKLGNHPEIIRFMYRAGKAISTEKYVGPSEGSGAAKAPANSWPAFANGLYPNQQN